MKQQKLEQFVRDELHMVPVEKIDHKLGTIYIAEGYVGPLEVVEGQDKDFPFGHYRTTFWIAKDEDVLYGPILYFNPFHDPEQKWTAETKQRARINATRKEAVGFLQRRERVNAN